MNVKLLSGSAVLVCSFAWWGHSLGASLPIPDGVYVTKPQICEDFRRGELEMIDFEVLNEGASFNYPEAGCVVAEVRDVRANRVRVTGDCDEAGEVWQSSFFLDDDKIALDGVPHYLCKAGAGHTDFGPEWAQFAAQPDEALCRFVAIRNTRNYWWTGDSDSEDLADLVPTSSISAGTEISAYRQGEVEGPPATGPNGTPLVFEFKGYFVPLADLKFVGKCGPSR